jgi:transaldolase
MPEATLKAFGEHGQIRETLAAHSGESERDLTTFIMEGVDVHALAARLQDEGTAAFVKSWKDLMACIESKMSITRKAG